MRAIALAVAMREGRVWSLGRPDSFKRPCKEGGPRLLADFFKQRLVSEQFLTLAPQIAGRLAGDDRMGMVMGKVFAPRNPLWGKLIDVRQGASHLFLRYSFD
jgi:riboflavin biosynthesis pyrimidine reductase